jgi:7-carboxy-7-deazaguanine synthase
MLKVNEIFYSIQGESSYAGRPCVFVRLTGCNLRCVYCDTTYAYEEGKNRAIGEIVQSVKSYDCRLVEVTGGEPLLQSDTPVLIDQLLQCKHTVLLETNGSCDISLVSERCIKIVDFKCPGSGMETSNRYENIDALSHHDEVKFVIGDRRDFHFARQVTERVRDRHGAQTVIHFAPVFGTLAPDVLAEWILEENLVVRIQLQLHKIIWPAIERGV